MALIPDGLLEAAELVAAETALPELGDAVVSAIDLAVQLLLHDVDQPTVARVAALDPKATRSDAEPAIREMLEGLGLAIPDRLDADGRYHLLRHGVGFWDIPIAIFEGPFYERIQAWDEQGAVDRALVQLLDQRDRITTTAGRLAVDARIRAVARYADDDATLRQIEAPTADHGWNEPQRLSRELAEAARRAWLRDEEAVTSEELPEERLLRDRAGTLALIGLAVDERGTVDGNDIVKQSPHDVLDGDAALLRGEFVEVDRLTLVSRVGWIELMSPTFVQAGERYRADWDARTVIVQRLDGTQHTFKGKPSGPDSIR